MSDNERKCPQCGAVVAEDSRFCASCGATLAKFCPSCGKPVTGGGKFCAACGASLAGNPGAASNAAASSGAAKSDGASDAVAEKICHYIRSTTNRSECVITGDNILPEMTKGFELDADEKPLVVIKNWNKASVKMGSLLKATKIGFVGKMVDKGRSTMLITDKMVRYVNLRSDAFLSTFAVVGGNSGDLRLEFVRQLAIGDHDHCYGTSYIGHQLVVNNQVVGLLRLSSGLTFDKEAIDYLTNMFAYCFGA